MITGNFRYLQICTFPFSVQSSAGSSGKTVVDSSTNLELQETNARLRERLARMVLHTKHCSALLYACTHPCKIIHTDTLYKNKRDLPPTQALFSIERCGVNEIQRKTQTCKLRK